MFSDHELATLSKNNSYIYSGIINRKQQNSSIQSSPNRNTYSFHNRLSMGKSKSRKPIFSFQLSKPNPYQNKVQHKYKQKQKVHPQIYHNQFVESKQIKIASQTLKSNPISQQVKNQQRYIQNQKVHPQMQHHQIVESRQIRIPTQRIYSRPNPSQFRNQHLYKSNQKVYKQINYQFVQPRQIKTLSSGLQSKKYSKTNGIMTPLQLAKLVDNIRKKNM